MTTPFALADSEIEYPETDGKPMGETDVHRIWTNRLIDMLTEHFRQEQTYVTGDLMVYYEEGSPHCYFAPDVMVAHHCQPKLRRTYKIWEEGHPPHAVIEVTSRSTRREDSVHKLKTYAALGIEEYFLYDPEGDYLKPPLRGYRLAGECYNAIEPDAQGRLVSAQLGVALSLEGGNLFLWDQATGKPLQTRAEKAEAEAESLRRLLRERSQSE